MNQATHALVLDTFAQCKAAAVSKAERDRIDRQAISIISQDIGEPQVMADNLEYWLNRCAA